MKNLNKDDLLLFLRRAYFGDINNPYVVASERAYRDFCRTIRSNSFKDVPDTAKIGQRDKITKYIETAIRELLEKEDISQNSFDEWHSKICEGIISRFPFDTMYYGQAQKWLNMMLKYLCALEVPRMSELFVFLHIPIDNIIIDKAVEQNMVKRPVRRWSRWTKEDYLLYQKLMREAIQKSEGEDYPPLLWEFRNWKD